MTTRSLPALPVPQSGDAFANVRAALLAVWPRAAHPEVGLSTAERNLVLDGCGSDHRPLVDLLLDLGHVLRPTLAARASVGLSTAQWQALRASQVHRIVSTRYLQHEVAQWSVQVWGEAMGVVTAGLVTAEAVNAEAVTTGRAGTALAGGALAGTALAGGALARGARGGRLPAVPAAVPASAVPAAVRNVPSWAGGPVSFGVGQRPKASTLQALAARGRVVVQHGPPGPKWQPVERRAAIVFGGLLVVCAVSMWVALERREGTAATADTAVAGTALADAALAGTARADTAPTERAPTERAPTERAPTDAAMVGEAATVRGETVAGDSLDWAAVADAHAIGYNLVPLPRARDAATGAAASAAIRETGVAGRYRVVQQIRSVDGTENCSAVATALAGGRISEEVVEHRPGTREFALSTRGVRGTLAADGYFETAPSTGVRNNVQWRFRMRGRFTPSGFTAESETYTDATIRWGRQQTCVVSAELMATRIAGGPS